MHPFKKLILYGLLTDHITLILSKDVFHKFYLVHSLILCFILHWCLEHHSNFAHSFSFLIIVPVFLIARSHFVLLLNIPILKIREEFWEKVSEGSHLCESLKTRKKDVFN